MVEIVACPPTSASTRHQLFVVDMILSRTSFLIFNL